MDSPADIHSFRPSSARREYLVAWLVGAICLPAAWSIQACEPKHAVVNENIQGQIFIVTQARQNIRLGLVPVGLYRDSTILSHLSNRARASARERLSLDSRAADARASLKAAMAAAAEGKATLDRLYDEYMHNQLESDEYDQKESEVRKKMAFRLRAAEAMAESVKAARARLSTPAFYMEGLPPPIVEVMTDADGKFAMSFPETAKVVLVARASRSLPLGGTEEYAWVVPLPERSIAKEQVLLSNHNLLPEDMSQYTYPR